MSSSSDPFQNYFDSREPKQELDSPFLNEAFFVDEEIEATSAWENRLNRFQLESPFLHAFEEGWGAIAEPEFEEFEAFLGELNEEELEEEFEEEEAIADYPTHEVEDLETGVFSEFLGELDEEELEEEELEEEELEEEFEEEEAIADYPTH